VTATAFSFGTVEWLRDLAASGWDLSVSESRRPGPKIVLRLVEDEFEPIVLAQPDRLLVGVVPGDRYTEAPKTCGTCKGAGVVPAEADGS
jgi:hypothetical protein